MLPGDPQFEVVAQASLEGWQFCFNSGQTELCNEACITPALALWQSQRRSGSAVERQIHPARQKDRNELLNFLMVMVKVPRVQRSESSKHLMNHIHWIGNSC